MIPSIHQEIMERGITISMFTIEKTDVDDFSSSTDNITGASRVQLKEENLHDRIGWRRIMMTRVRDEWK